MVKSVETMRWLPAVHRERAETVGKLAGLQIVSFLESICLRLRKQGVSRDATKAVGAQQPVLGVFLAFDL